MMLEEQWEVEHPGEINVRQADMYAGYMREAKYTPHDADDPITDVMTDEEHAAMRAASFDEPPSKWEQFAATIDDNLGWVTGFGPFGIPELFFDASKEGDLWIVPDALEGKLEKGREVVEGVGDTAKEVGETVKDVVGDLVPGIMQMLPLVLMMSMMQMMPRADRR